MGSKSRSRTSNTEIVNTTNENISGIEDSSIYSDSNVSINTLDGGAINRAFDFGDNALAANLDSLDAAYDFGGDSLDFGRDSLDFAGDGLSSILDFGTDIVEGQNAQLHNTLQSINAANANTAALESANQQTTIQQVAKVAGVVLVVASVAYIFKKVTKK